MSSANLEKREALVELFWKTLDVEHRARADGLVAALKASRYRDDAELIRLAARVERAASLIDERERGDDDDGLPSPTCALHAGPPATIPWAVEDLITDGDQVVFAGDGGSGKTSTTMHVCGALAGGYDVFDQFAAARRAVLVISEEDPISVLLNRLEAFIVGHKWDRARVLENVHVLAQQGVQLTDGRWRTHLAMLIERLEIRAIVYDSWRLVNNGREDSSDDTAARLAIMRALARPTGAISIIVHHAGKAGEGKRTIDRIRGSSDLVNSARVAYFFDDRPEGSAIECLKLSRAQKPDPFVVVRAIECDPLNRALWKAARLTVSSARTVAVARAKRVMQERLGGGEATSTELREVASAAGVRGEDASTAIRELANDSIIVSRDGKGNAKHWRLGSSLPTTVGQVGQASNSGPAQPAPTHGQAQEGTTLSLPFRARQAPGPASDPVAATGGDES